MLYTRVIAVSVALASVSLAGLQAQTLGSNPAPAEYPPSSFTADQYVDSRGCVFIRAGIDGNVTWVPRVTRDRRLVCGAQPSLGGGQTTIAAAPTDPNVEIIEPREPEETVAETIQPTPAPQRVVRRTTPSPAPEPTVIASSQEPAQASPQRTQAAVADTAPATVRATPSPAPEPQVYENPAAPARQAATTAAPTRTVAVRNQGTSACPNASQFSQRYINSGVNLPVRCGPQALTYAQGSVGSGQSVSGGGQRLLPSHLVESRKELSAIQPPAGYQPVWTDGRLNPHRATQTATGYKQSQQVMTHTVPRKDLAGNPRVQAKEPRVLQGQAVRVGAPEPTQPARQAAKSERAPTVAAKAERAPKAASTARIYVRVAQFSDATSARAGAQRMARTGIPTRMGKAVRGNTSVQLVLAGPFASRSEADRAVQAARRAGFGNATVLR